MRGEGEGKDKHGAREIPQRHVPSCVSTKVNADVRRRRTHKAFQ